MAAKTRLGLEGYGVRRAGSFAGKTQTAITQLVATATVGRRSTPSVTVRARASTTASVRKV